MTLLYILLFICLFLSFYLFVKGVSNTLSRLGKSFRKINPEEMDKALETKLFRERDYTNDRERIKYIKDQRPGFVERAQSKVKSVITHRDTNWGYFSYTLITILLALLGYWLGEFRMKNFIAGLILAITFAVIPYWYSQFRISKIGKDKDEKLLLIMSNIQSAYMRSNSFVNAVKEVLSSIPHPLHRHFEQFVDEISLFGTDDCLIPAMERLETALDNYFFSEYIQLAMQAERGEMSLKVTMQSVPKDYQNYLTKNHEFAAIIENYNAEFFMRIIALPMVIGFLKIVSDDFYNVLVTHPIGKLSFALLLLVYITAAVLYRRYNKEIKLEL